MRTLLAFLFGCLFAAVFLFPAYLHADAAPEPCPHTTVDGLTVLTANMPPLRGVSAETLSAVDSYLRASVSDDSLPHLLDFFRDNATVNALLAQHADWSGFAGVTLHGLPFAVAACAVDFNAGTPVDISLVQARGSELDEFGVIVHELSHASGTVDGAREQAGSAMNWEAVARNAYRQTCASLSTATEQAKCTAIDAILGGV